MIKIYICILLSVNQDEEEQINLLVTYELWLNESIFFMVFERTLDSAKYAFYYIFRGS